MWTLVLLLAAAPPQQTTTSQGNGHHANDERRDSTARSIEEARKRHGEGNARSAERSHLHSDGTSEKRQSDGALMPGAPGTNNPSIPDGTT